MKFNTKEWEIGSHFIPALVYGDMTNLSEQESVIYDNWWTYATQAFTDDTNTTWVFSHESVEDHPHNEFGRCEITNLRGATHKITLHFSKE